MSHHTMTCLSLGGAVVLLCTAPAVTQQRPTVTTITGHVAKAEPGTGRDGLSGGRRDEDHVVGGGELVGLYRAP